MGLAKNLWHEKLAGGEFDNKQFNEYVSTGPLTEFYSRSDLSVRTAACAQGRRGLSGLSGR